MKKEILKDNIPLLVGFCIISNDNTTINKLNKICYILDLSIINIRRDI